MTASCNCIPLCVALSFSPTAWILPGNSYRNVFKSTRIYIYPLVTGSKNSRELGKFVTAECVCLLTSNFGLLWAGCMLTITRDLLHPLVQVDWFLQQGIENQNEHQVHFGVIKIHSRQNLSGNVMGPVYFQLQIQNRLSASCFNVSTDWSDNTYLVIEDWAGWMFWLFVDVNFHQSYFLSSP